VERGETGGEREIGGEGEARKEREGGEGEARKEREGGEGETGKGGEAGRRREIRGGGEIGATSIYRNIYRQL